MGGLRPGIRSRHRQAVFAVSNASMASASASHGRRAVPTSMTMSEPFEPVQVPFAVVSGGAVQVRVVLVSTGHGTDARAGQTRSRVYRYAWMPYFPCPSRTESVWLVSLSLWGGQRSNRVQGGGGCGGNGASLYHLGCSGWAGRNLGASDCRGTQMGGTCGCLVAGGGWWFVHVMSTVPHKDYVDDELKED